MAEGRYPKDRYSWQGKIHPRLSVVAGNPDDVRRPENQPKQPPKQQQGKSKR